MADGHTSIDDLPVRHERRLAPVSTSLLGMILFIASEVMFFGALFGTYFTLRFTQPAWPPPGIPKLSLVDGIVMTVLLVSGSLTMQASLQAIRKGNQRGLVRYLTVTLAIGIIFLGVQTYDFLSLIGQGLTVRSGVYGSTYFTMMGFHGAHVVGGTLFVAMILWRARQGQFSVRHHDTVEMGAYYWFFLDVVWLSLFATFYLFSGPIG